MGIIKQTYFQFVFQFGAHATAWSAVANESFSNPPHFMQQQQQQQQHSSHMGSNYSHMMQPGGMSRYEFVL